MNSEDDEATDNRREILEFFLDNNIWQTPSVNEVPTKWLQRWQIYKVTKASRSPDSFGLHFIGYEFSDGYGAVSSKIESFDPVKMCGVTNSGRVYQLVGLPGSDPDAQHTLQGWAKWNGVVVQDATEEFIRHYEIDLEHVKAVGEP